MWVLSLLLLCTVWGNYPVVTQGIDPQYAETITVYHFHPPATSYAPANQNTADFGGTVWFHIYSIFAHYICSISFLPEMCLNQEIIDPAHRLVFTELQLEVDKRYGDYALCNLCTDGHDIMDNSSCLDGEYRCHCGLMQASTSWTTRLPGRLGRTVSRGPDERHCKAAVGRSDVTNMGRLFPNCSGMPHYMCWFTTLCHKISGFWFSTTAETECTPGGSPNCTWQLLRPVQQISKACYEDQVLAGVEASNRPCFQECRMRNFTSPCWMSCFVATVIGPDASTTGVPGGLPTATLLELWRQPLRSPAEGGCPRLPLHPSRGFWDMAGT